MAGIGDYENSHSSLSHSWESNLLNGMNVGLPRTDHEAVDNPCHHERRCCATSVYKNSRFELKAEGTEVVGIDFLRTAKGTWQPPGVVSFGIGFGSIEDFITVAALTRQIVFSLQGSGCSYCDYQELIRDTQRALDETTHLKAMPEQTPAINGICCAALKRKCTLPAFQTRFKEYDPSLPGCRPVGRMVEGYRKQIEIAIEDGGLGETKIDTTHDSIIGAATDIKE